MTMDVRSLWGRAAPANDPRCGRVRHGDEKVEKHRRVVRRAYYQKKALKAALQTEVSALEGQYEALMRETKTLAKSRQQRAYVDATEVKEALRKERDALEHRLLTHCRFHDRLTNSLFVRPHQERPQDAALVVQTPELAVWFSPLRADEGFALIRTALTELRSQTVSPGFRDVSTYPVMGWNRKRTLKSSSGPSFSLLKRFNGQSARRLWIETWQLYTDDSRGFEQLYSGAVDMRFHQLQRVDDSNVLFLRTLQTERLAIRHATVFLFSRVQADGEFLLLFRSVDADRVHTDHPAHAMLEMFSWLRFRDRDGQCEVELGGTQPSDAVADSDFWMMEFLSFVLRLEHRTIGPAFHVLL